MSFSSACSSTQHHQRLLLTASQRNAPFDTTAALLQGSCYEPPEDNARLVRSLRHTLDFMGLPYFPCNFNEVLMVPGYAPACNSDGDEGMLMYSAASKGWAAVLRSDPRPNHVPARPTHRYADRRWLAAVLRSEYTSAGELPLACYGSCTANCWNSCSASRCGCTSQRRAFHLHLPCKSTRCEVAAAFTWLAIGRRACCTTSHRHHVLQQAHRACCTTSHRHHVLQQARRACCATSHRHHVLQQAHVSWKHHAFVPDVAQQCSSGPQPAYTGTCLSKGGSESSLSCHLPQPFTACCRRRQLCVVDTCSCR
jgi:hypothetical protein